MSLKTLSSKPNCSKLEKKSIKKAIKGCLFGGALGDGYGLATEFMRKSTAKYSYGVGPIAFGTDTGLEFVRDSHRGKWHENDFTDDTDQSILLAQCAINNNGILHPVHFAYRLKEWVDIGFPEIGKRACGIGYTVGSVISHPQFQVNPHRAAYDVWDSKGREIAANGAVMRTAVLGIPYFWDEKLVVENTMNAAKVTHADPRCVISAVIVSVIVSRILRNHLQPEVKMEDNISIKVEVLRNVLLSGLSVEDENEIIEQNKLELKKLEPKAPPMKKEESGFLNLLRRLTKTRKQEEKELMESLLPTKLTATELAQRTRVAAAIPENASSELLIDNFGEDETMIELCNSVIEDYKWILKEDLLLNKYSKSGEAKSDEDWEIQLKRYCFPQSLSSLELDETGSIGYTFKCLGVGIYSVTRRKPESMTEAEFFKRIINNVALEGGDADTNCTVVGALLGVRFGETALPKEWMALRHEQFLESIVKDLTNFVFES